MALGPNPNTIAAEASSGTPLKGDFERMIRRRFQDPHPKREGNWWYLLHWQDEFVGGVRIRKRKRIKFAPASMPEREAKKIAAELLRPLNQGLVSVGSAVNFNEYVEGTYIPTVLPLLAKTTQDCYESVIGKYLGPSFSSSCLRDLSPLTLQRYFSAMTSQNIPYPSIVKVRDALSSILRSAVRYGFLVKNPLDGLQLPPDKRGRRPKPVISPEQFSRLVELTPEPYATMIYVAVWTGLRVSELIGLKWRCIHTDSITVEERYCRGDWAAPKSEASAATIGVEPDVIARIHRLKALTADVRAGFAVRRYKLVKADGADDLVFQSVKDGKPMSDGNILRRFLKPAGKKLGIAFVNWRCLRTSHATWLVQAGADPKSVQGQMRHSRISTTLDIYAQIVPQAQRHALEKLLLFAKKAVPNAVPLLIQ
jgi:integrase